MRNSISACWRYSQRLLHCRSRRRPCLRHLQCKSGQPSHSKFALCELSPAKQFLHLGRRLNGGIGRQHLQLQRQQFWRLAAHEQKSSRWHDFEPIFGSAPSTASRHLDSTGRPVVAGQGFQHRQWRCRASVNGYPITSGTAAACAQFGALICSKDLASLNASGQCPSQGNGGVRATKPPFANGTANLDGNSQSICSWGQVIQKKIDASGCSNGNQASPTQPINCPSPAPATGGLMAGAPSLRRIRRLAAPKHREPASCRQHRRRCFRRPNLALTALARGEGCLAHSENAFPSDAGPQSKEDQTEA